MRTKRLLLLLPFLCSVLSFGQNPINDSLVSPVERYNNERLWTTFKDPITKVKDSVQIFNTKMLNLLFANKVGTAFGGSNDLSLQKFYASLDANDKSISVGTNFDSRRGDELKRLKWIFSGGIKLKSSDKFATVYKDGDFQEDNIGVTFKISLIGRGIIGFKSIDKGSTTKLRKDAILNHHAVLENKYNEVTDNFNQKKLIQFTNNTNEALKYDSDIDSSKSELGKKTNKAYIAMAKEEVAYIEQAGMYSWLWNHWGSISAFVPFGENRYKTTPDLSSALSENYFYALNLAITYNVMWQSSCGTSIFAKAELTFKNNNNILIDNLESIPFQTTVIGSNNTTIVTESNDGYVTDYNQFLTTNLKIEPAIFFLNNIIGFSPAVEFNVGDYDKTNWKLGIPISLKDKEGKPKVNFEIQWKEINTFNKNLHLVGLSANFLFGDLIN